MRNYQGEERVEMRVMTRIFDRMFLALDYSDILRALPSVRKQVFRHILSHSRSVSQ